MRGSTATLRQIYELVRQAEQELFQGTPNYDGAHLGQENGGHNLDQDAPEARHVHKSSRIYFDVPQETQRGTQK